MRTILFLGLSFNYLFFPCELPVKAQTQLMLMRVINNTGQSYRLSVIDSKAPCDPQDSAYCVMHHKIRPISIIEARSQKLAESLIQFDSHLRSGLGSYHRGKLLLENLMNPDEYIVISIEQLCSYIKKTAQLSCVSLKPNKEKITDKETVIALEKNYNFRVNMDLRINSMVLSSVALAFRCQTD